MPVRVAPNCRRSAAACAAACAGTFLPLNAVRGAGDGDEPASIAAAAAMEMFDPLDLPGREPADRVRPETPPAPEPKPQEPPDWFGGKPWWEWQHISGNWGGARTALEDIGLTFNGSFTLDWGAAWSGGLSGAAKAPRLVDVNATLDLEKAFKLEGGSVYADFMTTAGGDLSDEVGDYQGVSNIQNPTSMTQLAELWYQQWLFDKVVRIKFGKVDANREFGFSTASTEFLNSSGAVEPTIVGFPTYPNPAMSLNIFVYPTDSWYIGAGLYDGATSEGINTGPRGPATFFSDSEASSWFVISETGYTFKELGPLRKFRLALGGWTQTAHFDEFDGGTRHGVWGMYGIGEAMVWKRDPEKEDDERGLWLFGQVGCTSDEVSAVGNHGGFGAHLVGTFDGRDTDSAGLYVTYADLSSATGSPYAKGETTVECYYRCNLTPCIHLQPDLQVVVNPSGRSDTAVVGILRVSIDF